MLDSGSHRHRVEVAPAGLSRVLSWSVDGRSVAGKKTSDDTVVLAPGEESDAHLGAVRLRFSTLGRPRRVTWFGPGTDLPATAIAHVGVGGIDLDPEPGSPAAIREARARAHPRLYAARHVVGGVAKVVVPLVIAALLARLAFQVPWPNIWLPDLPSIPWPNLPSIPWPDWRVPDWRAPAWLKWVLSHAKYVVPVIVGIVLARNEIRRRRNQDALKAGLRGPKGPTGPTADRARSGEVSSEE
jgi:hypothetical protein